jgi:protease I
MRIICFIVCLILATIIIHSGEDNMANTLNGKKVLMIIAANGFQDDEFGQPYNLLTKLGATVKIACSQKDTAQGVFGKQVVPDCLLSACKADDFDAVVFVGGPGSSEYFNNKDAHTLAREAAAKGKILGAICIAPVTLANAGVLKGKKATVYPSEENQLVKQGAQLVNQNVVVDGKIVTAPGPQAARDFAEALVKLLQ